MAHHTTEGAASAAEDREDGGIAPDPGFGLGLRPLPTLGFVTCKVPIDSTAATSLISLVQESLPGAVLTNLIRVGNAELWRCYQTQKAELIRNSGGANVKLLFHGTRTSPSKILGDGLFGHCGFDFRLSNDGQYGQGAYFARHAAYPVHIHPRMQDDQGTFTLIVAEVALGKVKDFGDSVDPSLKKPPPRDATGSLYDSVRGTEKGLGLVESTNLLAFGEQFVVYDLARAYPHFLLTFQLDRPPGPLALLRPGNHVALYAMHHRKFLSMGDETRGFKVFGLNEELDAAPLPEWRNWERFLVKDATDGKIALYNPSHGRYVRMCERIGDRDWVVDGVAELTVSDPSCQWEPIIPSDGGNGKVAIYNPSHKRLLRLLEDRVDGGGGEWQNDSVHFPPDELMRFIVLPHPPSS
jgi:hypothetical protein